MKATINLREGSDGAISPPHPEVQGGGIGGIAPPIRKCREASSVIGEGITGKKIKKTINLQGGDGGMGPPPPEEQGCIRRF